MVKSLCESEIDEFRKSVRVNHDVLRFEISEDDIFGMEMAYSIKDSANIEHGGVIIESAVAGESCKKLSSLYVLKHHVNVFGILKCGFPK